jgi:hypothetical protein
LATLRQDLTMVNLDAASVFMATHARLLDRRRLDVVLHGAPPDGTLAALSAYRNPDGGYGWGLEADLRATESQPGAALHAFEVFEDIAPPRPRERSSSATGALSAHMATEAPQAAVSPA